MLGCCDCYVSVKIAAVSSAAHISSCCVVTTDKWDISIHTHHVLVFSISETEQRLCSLGNDKECKVLHTVEDDMECKVLHSGK